MRNRIGRPKFGQGPASAMPGPHTISPGTDITIVPGGDISSTNVQAAIMELDAEKVAKAGDTMTGNLTLPGTGSSNLHAIHKGYVDANFASVDFVNAADNLHVLKVGDTMTGALTLPATDPTAINHAARKSYVDTADGLRVLKAGDVMSGHLGLPTGPAAHQAVRKDYVDAQVGLAGVTINDAAPAGTQGKLWWESDTGVLWLWYDDGSSSQWVQANGSGASDPNKADKTYVDAQDALKVVKTGDTMTGNLTLDVATGARVFLNHTGNNISDISFKRDNITRWLVRVGGVASGGNTGEDFQLLNFSDTETQIGTPLTINRATGATTLIASGGPLAINGWDENAASNINGALWIGANTSFQGRIRYDTSSGFGVLYIDNRQDAANANIVLRTRTSTGTPQTITMRNLDGALQVASATPSTSPTTGALTVAGGLGVGGASYHGNAISIQMPTASLPTAPSALMIGHTAAGANGIAIRTAVDPGNALLFYNAANTLVGNIQSTVSATAYNTSSDASLKEDLKSFDAGNIIDNTNVYDFKWKSTKERAYGVIAQQAIDVYPLAVFHQEASTEKGAERDEWWGIDYSKYVPVLIQAIKDLRAEIAELKDRLSQTPDAKPRRR